MKLIGPFKQIVTLRHLPLKGKIQDEALEIIQDGGILTDRDTIAAIGTYQELQSVYPNAVLEHIDEDQVLIPGFIDSHTHICFGGNRAKDFGMRLNGKTYLEIAASGGGIWSTVMHTRNKSQQALTQSTSENICTLIQKGITTAEVKSGYALNTTDELKMLRAIKDAAHQTPIDIIPTFLGAHMKPKDFEGSNQAYLEELVNDVFPILKSEELANRVDIFVEQSAFSVEEGDYYLAKAQEHGFQLTVHADQFTPGGSELAIKYKALSADHLEFSGEKEIDQLANSDVVATVLPGASIGLGMQYAPARQLLDAGCCVSIASDWNPGSAPMGDFLTQASILATFEKLSMAEILAGMTFRAAKALDLQDRGQLEIGQKADFISFPTDDFSNIIYRQGQLQPSKVWKNSVQIFSQPLK